MTFLSHKIQWPIIVGFSIFIAGLPSIAQDYVACPRLSNYNPYMHRQCSSQAFEQEGFNPCVLNEWASIFHLRIHEKIREECNTEMEVARIERIQEDYENRRQRAFFGGYEPPAPPPQLNAEQITIMSRLRPNEYFSHPGMAGTAGPIRSDDCAGDRVAEKVIQDAQVSCMAAARHARTVCEGANERVRVVQEQAERASEAAMTHRSPAAALEFAKEKRDILNDLRTSLPSINNSCADAITALRGEECLGLFENYFNNQSEAETIAVNCTHAGLTRNVESIAQTMEAATGPLITYSNIHIQNRTAEDQVRTEFIKLSNFIVKIEEQLNRDPNREVATETSGE